MQIGQNKVSTSPKIWIFLPLKCAHISAPFKGKKCSRKNTMWLVLTLFWPICTGWFCSAHFVLSLFLHWLIMFWTTLYCGTFCTEPPFTSAYYVPDNFALWPILHWYQLWISLLCIGGYKTRLSRLSRLVRLSRLYSVNLIKHDFSRCRVGSAQKSCFINW